MALTRSAANIADELFGWHPRGWASGFLAHLHSPWGYDEPEILRYSNRQFGHLGAEEQHFITGNVVSYASSYRGVISIEILDH
jgi:hypothetical protein